MKNPLEIMKKYNEQYKEVYGEEYKHKLEDFSCNECGAKDHCIYAWDLYNTNGDCLAEK
jgi:hypothetical protein